MGLRRLAVIDLGTNTIILLVAEIPPSGGLIVLHDEARVARLGEGIHANPRLLPVAMDRALAVLKDFSVKARELGAERIIAVGTAALRNAGNACDFLARARAELGLAITVIPGSEEARLIHLAVIRDFPSAIKPLLVLDIGGGSTEFIFDTGLRAIDARSLAFGSVKLTERFLRGDPPTTGEIAALDAYLKAELASLPAIPPQTLVATAGTATTISALTQNMTQYDASRVHGSRIMTHKLASLSARLENMTYAGRIMIPCLEPKRADVIIAGARILSAVARHFGLEEITVSDRGLRFGIFYEQMLLHAA